MAWFRHAVTTNTTCDIEREHEAGCSSAGQKPKKESGFSRNAYRRFALRNHLRTLLRQKPGRQ